MSRSFKLSSLALAGALFACPAVALADRIHLDNGKVVEGTVEKDGAEVVITKHNGIEIRLPAERVLKVEKSATPAQRYAEKLAALPADDLAAARQLVDWCEQNKLKQQAAEVRRGILATWPNDAETRRELGFVRHAVGGQMRWITRAEYMESLGLVQTPDGNSWISPEEAERRGLAAQVKQLQPQIEKVMRTAYRSEPKQLSDRLAEFPDRAVVPILAKYVDHYDLGVRTFAMQQLAERKAPAALARLVEAAVEDPASKGRETALMAINAVAEAAPKAKDKVSDYFVRATKRENAFQRINAAQALGAFPSRAAIPALIVQLRESTGNFARVSISILTQRAYISDFEVSSGGTGLVVAEVADPIVETFQEGITLDTKVLIWERYSVVRVLQRVTGQQWGYNADSWQKWWNENRKTFNVPAK